MLKELVTLSEGAGVWGNVKGQRHLEEKVATLFWIMEFMKDLNKKWAKDLNEYRSNYIKLQSKSPQRACLKNRAGIADMRVTWHFCQF